MAAICLREDDGTIANTPYSATCAITDGGAFYGVNAPVTVGGSTFSDNRANNSGGGIFNTSDLYIANSTFSGNSADNGGGIRSDGGDFQVLNSTFSNNSAITNGGAFSTYLPATLYTHVALPRQVGTAGETGPVSLMDCGDSIPIDSLAPAGRQRNPTSLLARW
jgi:predicted outer membrane repeat protein